MRGLNEGLYQLLAPLTEGHTVVPCRVGNVFGIADGTAVIVEPLCPRLLRVCFAGEELATETGRARSRTRCGSGRV